MKRTIILHLRLDTLKQLCTTDFFFFQYVTLLFIVICGEIMLGYAWK